MRAAVLALLLLGGCLIVRTYEEPVEELCPMTTPQRLAFARGPLAVGTGFVYFVDNTGRLARMSTTTDAVTPITTGEIDAHVLAVDDTNVYWITGDGELFRVAVAGDAPISLGVGFPDPVQLVSSSDQLAWAAGRLFTLDKPSGTITTLADSETIVGTALVGSVAYFVDAQERGFVRKAPPIVDLAPAEYPSAIDADGDGIYFYEKRDLFDESAGRIRHIALNGGEPVTTARDLPAVLQLQLDGFDIYFTTIAPLVAPVQYRIRRVGRFGGGVISLACGPIDESQPVLIALDTNDVYWTAGGGLYRVTKSMFDF